MKTRLWISAFISLALLVAAWPSAAPAPAAAQSGNLLANGGFEEPPTGGATGNFWQAWWQETPRPDDGMSGLRVYMRARRRAARHAH